MDGKDQCRYRYGEARQSAGDPRNRVHPGDHSAAFREVIRMAAVHDLVALGEAGAFDFLLEPGAEEQMWG